LELRVNLFGRYDVYLSKKDLGLKAEASLIAEEIVAELKKSPNYEFVIYVCNQSHGKINHAIWEKAVLPELEKHFDHDANAIRALIQTKQNAYTSRDFQRRYPQITTRHLIDRLLSIDPNDEWAKNQKINELSNWLDFVIHEWPSGILYGMNGATYSECDEILSAVEELRSLANSENLMGFCNDVNGKVKQYQDRLTERDGKNNNSIPGINETPA